MSNKSLIFSSKTLDQDILKKLGISSASRIKPLNIHEQRIINLFENKDVKLSITDIVLGYYNKYTKGNTNEKIVNRNYMGLITYRMAKKNILKQCGKGIYGLN